MMRQSSIGLVSAVVPALRQSKAEAENVRGCIDFDRTSERTPERDFNAERLLKPGLSVEPEVRVR
jgi:hypothetical protein